MTAPLVGASQYATAKPFYDRAGATPANLSGSPDDSDRIRSYGLYEDFYYNRPENFKVYLRGDNDDPLYIPSAKKIIEAMNRFLCKGFTYKIASNNDSTGAALLDMHFGNLFKREEVQKKFASQKRMGLIRGDAMWYIVADPAKPQGSRLSIHELHPGNYFPIYDPNDKNRILGCHIVEVVHDPREADDKSKTIAKRRTYLKAGVSFNSTTNQYEQAVTTDQTIYTEVTHWAIGKWDDRNMKAADLERVQGGNIPDVAQFQLPSQITSLPVYHWDNVQVTDSHFGLSELAGVEALIAGANQTLSDTQLTMVLQGLGIYVTDSKPPQNSDGSAAQWEIGPGSVAEIKDGGKFERVSGVGSVQPALDLLKEIKDDIQEGSGIPDIAAGKVDVTVAESGISLSLQLAPILASSREKEQSILAKMDHMLYDLKTMWFPAYEGVTFSESAEISSFVEDPMPVNREAKIQEVLLLFTSGLITIAMAQTELAKLGYQFAAGSPEQVLRDVAALAAAQSGQTNRYAPEDAPKPTELNAGAGQLPGGAVLGDPGPGTGGSGQGIESDAALTV